MELILKGEPNEIAALVLQIQIRLKGSNVCSSAQEHMQSERTFEMKLLDYLADENYTIGQALGILKECQGLIPRSIPAAEWTEPMNHTCKELVLFLDQQVLFQSH